MSGTEAEGGYREAAARLERALRRLQSGVDALGARMRVHIRSEAEIEKLIGERARFAAELDRTSARAKRLDDGASEVARRLVAAMEEIRGVLAREG